MMRAVLLLGCATACAALTTPATCATAFGTTTAGTADRVTVFNPDSAFGKSPGTNTNTGQVHKSGGIDTTNCVGVIGTDPPTGTGCHRYYVTWYKDTCTTANFLEAQVTTAGGAADSTATKEGKFTASTGLLTACATKVADMAGAATTAYTGGTKVYEYKYGSATTATRCHGSELSQAWAVTTTGIDTWLESATPVAKKIGGADYTGTTLAGKSIVLKNYLNTNTGVDGAGGAATTTTSGSDATVTFTVDNSGATGVTHTALAAAGSTFETEFKAVLTGSLWIKDTQIKDYAMTKISGNRMRALADEAQIAFTICRTAVCSSTTSSSTSNATNATATSDDDDKVACVALDAPVVVKGRGEVPLRDLKFGDDVQDSAAGTYSPFVAWLHRSEDAADFLELRHETGTLSITPGHLLKLDGAFDAARYARAGRTLQTPAGPSTILSVTASRRAGFAAPLTRSGTIVVAGSEISCYHEAPGAWGSADAVHQLANAGFLPLRWGLPVDGATYANALGGINSVISTFVKMTGADLHLYARTLIGGSSFM